MSRPPAVRATKIDTRRINGGSELQMEFSRRGKQLGAPLSMHAQTGVDPWYRDLNDAYLRAPMRLYSRIRAVFYSRRITAGFAGEGWSRRRRRSGRANWRVPSRGPPPARMLQAATRIWWMRALTLRGPRVIATMRMAMMLSMHVSLHRHEVTWRASGKTRGGGVEGRIKARRGSWHGRRR